MEQRIQTAFITGLERVSAWADLLDEINVFPVPDADTGRNLLVSLSPLRNMDVNPDKASGALLRAASGNSGNIAVHFLSRLLQVRHMDDLSQAVREGCDAARASVARPEPGTMLSVFDALAEQLEDTSAGTIPIPEIIEHLAETVRQGPELLPVLKEAGVVDAGALGMFIFLEGFLGSLADETGTFPPVTERFQGWLKRSPAGEQVEAEGRCINVLVQMDQPVNQMDQPVNQIDQPVDQIDQPVDQTDQPVDQIDQPVDQIDQPVDQIDQPVDQIDQPDQDADDVSKKLAEWGESVVTSEQDGYLKIHLHSTEDEGIREKISSLGRIVEWEDEKLVCKSATDAEAGPVHIMTDGAGSVTREDARRLGITLLDSVVIMGREAVPETHLSPEKMYWAMRQGIRVTTSQASVFERHQHYQSVLSRYERVLYLCVGSVYTGNYETAMAWKADHDPENRFNVIDTGAASGRLGILALAAARYARSAASAEQVIQYAEAALSVCEEYIFIDRLNYLAAGGRLSKTSAFLGNLLHIKPVISPLPQGAQKVGTARNGKEQLAFFTDKLERFVSEGQTGLIMLEYSDNRAWVETRVQPAAEALAPDCEILLRPLSLTSGAHMGPGTWGAAFLREP